MGTKDRKTIVDDLIEDLRRVVASAYTEDPLPLLAKARLELLRLGHKLTARDVLLATPIEDLGFITRIYYNLARAELRVLGDIVDKTELELLLIVRSDHEDLRAIKDKLAENNLQPIQHSKPTIR